MTKPREKKGVTQHGLFQHGVTDSPKQQQQQLCDQQDEQRRPADGDRSAGPLSLSHKAQ